MDYEKKIREYMVSSKVDQLYKSMLINLFPELAESEDEKIRKEIKAFIKSRGSQITQSKTDGWLAWLKKQGEHAKFCDSIQVEDKVTRNEDGVLVNLSQLKRVAKKDEKQYEHQHFNANYPSFDEAQGTIIVEKQGEQKQPKELTNSEFVEKCKGLSRLEQHILALVPTRPIDAIKVDARTIRYLVEQEQGEQKPAEWNEEDETVLNNLIYALANDRIGNNRDEYVEYLKSLKDRVQPQPKQEWNEEDESHIRYLIECLEHCKKGVALTMTTSTAQEYINWLKSLRPQNWTKEDKERYISCLQRLSTGNPEQPETINSKWFKEHVYPQKQWKPSEEQMEALESATENCAYSEYQGCLRELIEQLKKLRGA